MKQPTRPRPSFRPLPWLLAAWLLAPAASAAVEADWVRADANKDGKTEWVAVTNAADVAFDERGEIVGWYLKTPKGNDFRGDYSRAGNLIKNPVATVTLPGGAAGKVAAEPPRTSVEGGRDARTLTARFAYSQGGARVEKTWTVRPFSLTLGLASTVTGVPSYALAFEGLGGGDPTLKALPAAASRPQAAGEVQSARYAALQCCNTALGNTGQALIVRPEEGTVPVRLEDAGAAGRFALTLPGGRTSRLRVYGGPNELVRLDLEGYAGLPGLFDPNLLGQLSVLLIRVLQFLRDLLGSWGLAIVGITVLIKLVTWPLLQTQMRSTSEMQALQPRIKEINEKFKDKPEKKAEATMALYRERGVNPAAGCLPLLIQMPVLLVMWRVIANYEFDQGFLWLRDLSLPDPLYVLPALYVGSMVLQTYMSTLGNRDMFRQQLIIQVVFVYIVLSFPAGVTLYWVLSTLLGVLQQYLINRQIKARDAGGTGPKGPRPARA